MSESWKSQQWLAIPLKWVGLNPAELHCLAKLVRLYTSKKSTLQPDDVATIDPSDYRSLSRLAEKGAVNLHNPYKISLDWDGPDSLVIRRIALRRSKEDASELNCDPYRIQRAARHVHKSLALLTLTHGWSPEGHGLSIADTCNLQQAAQRFTAKRFNVKRGGCVWRIYHVLCTSGSKELRKHVLLDGEALTEVDIKAAFPTMLVKFVVESERDDYWKLLFGDIYTALAPSITRDIAKVQMMQLLAGCLYDKQELHRNFRSRFPLTALKLITYKAQGHSQARYLQDMESHIMLMDVAISCAEQSIPFISVHDGCLVPRSFDPNLVKDAFRREVGFDCQLHVRHPSPLLAV